MTNTLGIDHPLVAVQDLATVRKTYESFGFKLSPQGQHPWGTATSLVLFRHQILEFVSIGDPSLLDGYAAGSFRFGRHIESYLDKREGVALTALYTEDANATEDKLVSQDIKCDGTIEFGRDVIRPDGIADRTRTTLKVFSNNSLPRLSVFACQQHRRDLLEFPKLMDHHNSAHGIEAVTVLCAPEDKASSLDWLCRVHHTVAVNTGSGETIIKTENGFWRLCDLEAARRRFGPVNLTSVLESGPTIIGIDIRVHDLAITRSHLNIVPTEIDGALILSNMEVLGGVMLRFVEAPLASAGDDSK